MHHAGGKNSAHPRGRILLIFASIHKRSKPPRKRDGRAVVHGALRIPAVMVSKPRRRSNAVPSSERYPSRIAGYGLAGIVPPIFRKLVGDAAHRIKHSRHGECRRLHRDVPVLNEHGIGVRYLAYPRGGIGSRAFDTMQAIWCAADRQQALTDAKNGAQFASKKCKNPVEDEYLLGQKFGIRGTPGIYTENGDELPGYVPPDDLIKIVGQ